MSANLTCSSALRKKQDEKNLGILRALLTQPANKFCFECGQRGPTYVNITTSTFCCMHCSGLLRGLNPPHRVKSISLSTFTDDEINSLKAGGNEINAKIWLGLYEKKVKFEPRVDDEIRQHLIQKYENRRWYFSPDDLEQQKRLLDEHQQQNQAQKSAIVAPLANDSAPISAPISAAAEQKLVRRDSVKSHQSNQSAPPNLHPNHRQDPFDLLTGDFPLKSSFTVSRLAQPSSGSSLGTIFPSSNSQSGTLTPTRNDVGSLQQLPKPFETNFPNNSIVQNRTVPDAQTSFAEFDAQFDALKINRRTLPAFPMAFAPSSFIPSSNNAQNQLPQRPASTTVQMNVTTDNARRTGIKDDGKPIMSTPTNLPDYSALEALFRGSSQNEASPSTMNTWSTLSTPAFEAASVTNGSNLGKSSTIAGFQHDPFQPQQPHSISDFTIANDANFEPFSSSDAKKSSTMSDNSAKNWNPFL